MGCGASSKSKYEDKKPPEETKPAEVTKPVPAQQAEATQPAEETKPAPAASATPTNEAKPPEVAKPAEAATPAEEATPEPAPAAPEAAPAAEAAAPEASAAPAREASAALGEEEGDEGDVMDDAEFEKMMQKQKHAGARHGIMAETVMPDADWKPPVNEKTPEQRARIEVAVSQPQAFMFHGLESGDLETLIMAFMEHKLEVGEVVIKQGDDVAAEVPGLFVIESGELDVFKSTGADEEPNGKKVFTYMGSGQFGELALLYNAPRAATVIASTPSVVWSIDRNTFNVCVKQAAVRRADKYNEFLNSIELLSRLDPSQRSDLAAILKEKVFSEGDVIIKQGDKGDDLYILEEGSAVARKDGEDVLQYAPKDYFGELALIRASERAADVVATATPTKVVTIDQASFMRLLEPLVDQMKENAKRYVGMEGGLT